MKFGEALKQKLIDLKLNTRPIIGCSEQQIDRVMKVQGVKRLPDIYRQYLRVMGMSSGDLYTGTDVDYRFLHKLKIWAEKILKGNNSLFVLPDDAFVFLTHQGWQFTYFHTDTTDDDPPVYYWSEVQDNLDKPTQHSAHLSEFLTITIEDIEGTEAQLDFLLEYT